MEGTPEQQVQQLKEEYERKVAEIQSGSVETRPEAPSPEHQAVSEVTEGMIQRQVPDFKATSHEPGHSNDQLAEDARAKVQEWVNMAWTQGPAASVKAAQESQDMALIDAFHGALTSEALYHQMIKEGKLPEVK